MNKCIFYCRVASDIDFRVNGEHRIARFSVAVDRKTKERKTDFLRMVAFGKHAELINNGFHKGSRISIEAMAVQPDKYTNQAGQTIYPNVEFWINSFDFVDTKAENQGSAPQAASAPQTAKPAVPQSDNDFMSVPDGIDSELPFS